MAKLPASVALLGLCVAVGAQKAIDSRSRSADAGPSPLFGAIGLRRGDPFSNDRKPARRHITANTLSWNLGATELFAKQLRKFRDCTSLHSHRNLFRQKLEEQLTDTGQDR